MVLQTLLRATAFRNPLLRTLVPTVALAYGIQTAVAIPSIAAETERFYDLSGSLTYLSCTALSLVLPYLRARSAGNFAGGLSEYLSATGPGQAGWWWRQAILSAGVTVWASRCKYTLSFDPLERDVKKATRTRMCVNKYISRNIPLPKDHIRWSRLALR